EAYVSRSGIDAAVNYNLQTDDWGRFNFQLNYTDYLTNFSRTLASDPLVNRRNQNVETRMTATASWMKGPWDVTLYGLRYGGVEANNAPWIIWSAAVGYQFDKRVKMTLNVNNIFNKIGTISQYAGGFQFIST